MSDAADHDELAERAALALQTRLGDPEPEVFLTLGSGLSGLADAIEDPVDVPVAAVPGLPVSQVPGHRATLRLGTLAGRTVLAQLGRVHLYEGYHAAEVARTVAVASLLSCSTFVVTNAAGGLRPDDQEPGQVMVISDQLNLTGQSPLAGPFHGGVPPFTDMTQAYDPELRDLATRVATARGVPVLTGVYAGLTGPAYETPAEVRMLRALGADAVGMSTVNEVIAARANALRVVGISTLTNVHREGATTSHEEVLAVGGETADAVSGLILGVLEQLPPRSDGERP